MPEPEPEPEPVAASGGFAPGEPHATTTIKRQVRRVMAAGYHGAAAQGHVIDVARAPHARRLPHLAARVRASSSRDHAGVACRGCTQAAPGDEAWMLEATFAIGR